MTAPQLALAPISDFARDVRAGLSKPGQKELPSKYLYDDLGTALFEAITWLPEYGLTRADERLLRAHAGAIVDRLPGALRVAELGSGTGRKTRYVLEALARRQPALYHPIDISRLALDKCQLELASLGSVSVVGLEQTYLDGLREVALRRRADERLLLLFLGSNIGNFERPAEESFLREIRRCVRPDDALLLGMDLEKPVARMLLAYDDPAGVTSAFNLNLMARINRELGADFVLRNFAHEARYDGRRRRIEMHLRSLSCQTIMIPAASFVLTLAEGETIWTEACHKFQLDEIPSLAERCGFSCDAQWVDAEWPFAESLWIAR